MKTILAAWLIPAMLCFTAIPVEISTADNGTPLMAMLDGASEVPGPGDPDGTGTVYMTLNQGQGTITYELMVENIDASIGAHIHIGNSTVAGPVVVALAPPVNGMSSGTIEVDPELIKAIRKNPGDYYVNVHTSTYPAGAVRGQLMK